jgi:hypothetical protein
VSHIRLQAVDGEDHLTLPFEPFLESFLVRQVQDCPNM